VGREQGSAASGAWWGPYLRWPVVLSVLWLVLAAARIPGLADTALLPGVLLPVLLSTRGPLAGKGLLILARAACAIGPILIVHLRNPDYFATVRGNPAPVWVTNVPTRTEIWGQIAAAELVLLVLVEVVSLAFTWWSARVPRVDSQQPRR
jgi:hypothetical protein